VNDVKGREQRENPQSIRTAESTSAGANKGKVLGDLSFAKKLKVQNQKRVKERKNGSHLFDPWPLGPGNARS